MKVILTTPTYPPFNSGLGNVVHRQALALAGRGYDVVVVTNGAERSTSTEAGGVRVERFAVTGADYLRSPIRGDVDGYLSFLRSEARDVLVMHAWQTWSTDIPLARLAELPGRKYVHSHCISTNMWLPYIPVRSLAFWSLWRPYWWKLSRRMRALDGVIFLAEGGDDSRFDDLRLAKRLGLPIAVVPNPLEAAPVDLGSPERTQIISVGSYSRAKGFDFVLEAYVKSSAFNQIPLVLFGQELTSYAHDLKAQATALGIAPSMLSLREGVSGNELLSEYSKARLFLFGSYTECQPLVLLDAMATGTPFVSRNTGCIAYMPGGVPVITVEEAAAQINLLLADKEQWQTLSAAGREAARTTYSEEQSTAALIRALGLS